jgi:hypothetical protein
MKPARTLEYVKGLHQYYRDCLSQPVDFPATGQLPPELIEWVTDRRNTDVCQLVEYLEELPGSGLPPEEDKALRLALFTTLQANLATDFNNRYPDYTLPDGVAANIKRSLGRILELHPAYGYIAICAQLLYRIKELEEVLALAEAYPDIFAGYPVLQAITGFIHTMLGDYDKGLHYLQPLADDPQQRDLPLVALSVMTCQFMRGQTPEWPLTFDSFQTDAADLERLLGLLPPLEMVQPLASTPRPVVFVACDSAYFFQHVPFLAYSIQDTNAGKLDLHVHLYGPDRKVLAEIEQLRRRLPGLSIGVSAEYGTAPVADPASYYATARFVRAWQVLSAYRCELCLIDADALFHAGWESFQARLRPETELVLARPAVAPFWEEIIAGFVYCKPTDVAGQFLGKVAQFILRNMERGSVVWFTDQVALSATNHACTAQDPKVQQIDAPLLIDVGFGADALCWTVTTRKQGNQAYDAARARLQQRYFA